MMPLLVEAELMALVGFLVGLLIGLSRSRCAAAGND